MTGRSFWKLSLFLGYQAINSTHYQPVIPPRPQHEVTHFQFHGFLSSAKRKEKEKRTWGCVNARDQGPVAVDTSLGPKFRLVVHSFDADDDERHWISPVLGSQGMGFGKTARRRALSFPSIMDISRRNYNNLWECV